MIRVSECGEVPRGDGSILHLADLWEAHKGGKDFSRFLLLIDCYTKSRFGVDIVLELSRSSKKILQCAF